MVAPIEARLNLPLQQTHSIDLSKRELLATSTSLRTIKDNNFGGQGEKETVVPTIRNIVFLHAPASMLSSFANDAKNGAITASTGGVTITKINSTNIKGVA